MALSANRDVDRYVDQELRSYLVAGGAHVYKGGFVGLDANGYARALQAADQCVGLAYEECDNSAGSDGDKQVRVYTQGDFLHALSGAALTNIGGAVYASDDETLSFTATGNSLVGVCVDRPEANKIILRLDPHHSVSS
ncbi:MAG: capsid cement protein [Phycisphaerae bacterium]